MRKLTFLIAGATMLLQGAINAQTHSQDVPFSDLPANHEYGKCYAKCHIPDQYETVNVSVLVKPSYKQIVKVPAEYDTKSEQILVRESSISYKNIPATYKSVTEQIVEEAERTEIKTVPAQYRTASRQILVTEAHGEWVKKQKAPNCFSKNPEDCYVVCFEEVPAKYRTETYQEEVTPARTEQITIPARFTTITKRVVDQPARTEQITIPAEYRTINRRVVVQPASASEVVVEAVYKTVQEKRLVKQGGYSVWTEILCSSKTTTPNISRIQQSLKDKGLYDGPVDGVLGVKTQTALKQYQINNNLPAGNLNMETLNSLGVNTLGE